MKKLCFAAIVAIALSPFAHAQDANIPAGEIDFDADYSVDATDQQKSQARGGSLEFSGSGSWSGNQAAGTVTFAFSRLTNTRTTRTSGLIRAAIVLTLLPDGGPLFSYYPLGGWQFANQLPPLWYFENFNHTVTMLPLPPSGIYYVHLAAFEYEPGYGCSEDYCIDHYRTFPTRVIVSGGTISNYDESSTTTPVVEYFHTGFGHYFVTADPAEIAGLDAGAYGGVFVRTGQTWKVWTASSGTGIDVCRFFTTPGTFGTKSSHFYTADYTECQGLKFNPNWIYEKIAGRIAAPVNGTCPTGTQPIYRLYNNGQTGAPNHRYTTSLAIRSQMIGQGFVPEDANTACVPL